MLYQRTVFSLDWLVVILQAAGEDQAYIPKPFLNINRSIFTEEKYSEVYGIGQNKKGSASSVNRTRASSMATTNSTTRPMMLKNQANRRADSLAIFTGPQLDS
ncbi:hypothetical protein N7530_005352 [Penicillium desertorum]|uniref:Uncharacterized protein n=1 Tax=Penicillium desertorum TaxID=1303715 RepID=A0A9X0BRE0_9EURO|nr:hypothetical protein N7530_005352 [Penicillium desertorum]